VAESEDVSLSNDDGFSVLAGCPCCGAVQDAAIARDWGCGVCGCSYTEMDINKGSMFKETLQNLDAFLTEKNKKYGNSALEPLEVFTGKTSPLGIGVRIDDKLSRIVNGKKLLKNDVVDLVGYLILLLMSNKWTDFKELSD
jgi:hypothetical protein